MPSYEDVVADLGFDPLADRAAAPATDTIRVIDAQKRPTPFPRG